MDALFILNELRFFQFIRKHMCTTVMLILEEDTRSVKPDLFSATDIGVRSSPFRLSDLGGNHDREISLQVDDL